MRQVGTPHARDHLLQRVEQHDQPAAAGVHDPGPGQHLELLGRARQGLARALRRGADHRGQVRGAVLGDGSGVLGRDARDGQHGALDRGGDRVVRAARSRDQG